MRQYVSGNFRNSLITPNQVPPTNITDFGVDGIVPQNTSPLNPTILVQRTGGAVLIDQLQFAAGSSGPLPNQKWTLISMSITAGLFIGKEIDGVGGTPVAQLQRMFGDWGSISAGMILETGTIQTSRNIGGGQASPFALPIAPIPTDQTIVETLWDAPDNSLPPIIDVTNATNQQIDPSTTLQVSATITPPEPIELISGVPVFGGIWMNPSILGMALSNSSATIAAQIMYYLAVTNAQYNINYDDGL